MRVYPQALWTRPFPASVGHVTISNKDTTNRSAPEQRRCNAARGPGRTKGTRPAMNRVRPTTDPRPSICPTCGLTADNAILVEAELTRTATYVDTSAHMWAVTWMAVA